MGLQSVEFVLEGDRRFGVNIPDQYAEKFETVGGIVEFITTELNCRARETCLTSRMFYTLRRAIIESFGVDRSAVHVDTKLETLIPLKGRRGSWVRLRNSIADLPALNYSGPTLAIIFVLLLISLIISIACFRFGEFTPGFSFACLFGIIIGLFIHRPFATQFPCRASSIRELVTETCLSGKVVGPSKADVELCVRKIASEAGGIKLEKVKMESRFIGELFYD